jgi:DNA-binding NarL/FixJ family response regulator
MPNGKRRVLIADDEPAARLGVRQRLAAYPEFSVVGDCRDGREVLSALETLRQACSVASNCSAVRPELLAAASTIATSMPALTKSGRLFSNSVDETTRHLRIRRALDSHSYW